MATEPIIPDSQLPAARSAAADDDGGLPPKPIVRPPSRAKSAARQRLAEALAERHFHDEASATAIARAVVDPTRTRLALNSPINERVPGGTLHLVHVDVWPAAVTPSPINPRAAGDRPFPAGTPSDPRRRHFRRPLVSAGCDAAGAPVLTLAVEDQDHLVEALQNSMDVLMSTADKLIADLPLQGVMRPITVVPLRITHEDGEPDLTMATSPDGSSRTTIAWGHWGLETAAEVYRSDDRKLGQRIARVEALADKDASLLTDDERALLRLATMPAEVIVGYTPDTGSSTTFAQAVEAWVAAIHIDPPRPWGTSADLDTKASTILTSFADQAGWSREYVDYMAGMLTPDEASQAGFRPDADARAVEIIAVMGDDDNMRILNDGLRRLVGGGRRPRRAERLEPLVELALRPLRGTASPAEVSVARVILSNLRDMADWNRRGWHPSGLDLPSLRSAAGTELAEAEAAREDYEGVGQVGPYVLELAFMAAFWLARHGGLRRQTHRGEGYDDREPQHLLREMMTSTYGLDIFQQVIDDGRAGHAPRAIRQDRSIATNATGAEIQVSTEWLKEAFPLKRRTDPGPDRPNYTQAVLGVRNAITDLSSAVRSLTAVQGPAGEQLAQSLGIKPAVVEDMRRDLSWVSDELAHLGRMWQQRHTPDDGADENDNEEVDA
ncbi:MAG: hypothetical protein ACRDY2_14185 [Acidimicrobiales bacterium]